MKHLTLEQQRKRMDTIRFASENIISSLRKHRIQDYIPGQVIYNLGEYPARFSIKPTEYDHNLIKTLA
ncbi:MAG: hypothetical protein IKY52_02755, partial [Clostridia bacterium]|nr:hypothetical protein [Clostridia bacterium]